MVDPVAGPMVDLVAGPMAGPLVDPVSQAPQPVAAELECCGLRVLYCYQCPDERFSARRCLVRSDRSSQAC